MPDSERVLVSEAENRMLDSCGGGGGGDLSDEKSILVPWRIAYWRSC